MGSCVFCNIVEGKIPSHQVWSSDSHVAFLNISPAYKGMSVVIPKEHLSSNLSTLSQTQYSELWLAAKQVALKIQESLGVSRCALVAEGTGVDHAHIKVYPLHGYQEGTTYELHQEQVFDRYPGYITTMEGPVADNETLGELAKKIRGTNTT